jgi:hypothetical protein
MKEEPPLGRSDGATPSALDPAVAWSMTTGGINEKSVRGKRRTRLMLES